MRALLLLSAIVLAAALPQRPSLDGRWRGVLDLSGGMLPFELAVAPEGGRLIAKICNGPLCSDQATVTQSGSTVLLDIADYAATITAERRGDSLVGTYQNVGRNGPRTIPFRASRGSWPRTRAPAPVLGSWDA